MEGPTEREKKRDLMKERGGEEKVQVELRPSKDTTAVWAIGRAAVWAAVVVSYNYSCSAIIRLWVFPQSPTHGIRRRR